MAAIVTRKRGRNRRADVLQRPRGLVHPRVQKVSPEHFGNVAVDCAKACATGLFRNNHTALSGH